MSNVVNLTDFRDLSRELSVDILARTLWGEARGEGQSGMTSMASLIMNRVRLARSMPACNYWWGNTVFKVCTAPLQFSCWNSNDPALQQLRRVDESDAGFAVALRIARWAVGGGLGDNTGGATHYHALNVMPSWAMGHAPTAVIGRHVFYKIEPTVLGARA